jgi:hypothetical protein
MAIGLAPFFVVNGLLNLALRGKDQKFAEDLAKKLECVRHENRLDEISKQRNINHENIFKNQEQIHKNHIKEIEESHRWREEEQAQLHEYRKKEQEQASWFRCREIAFSKFYDAKAQEKGHFYRSEEQKMAHRYRINEIYWSSDLQLYRDQKLRQIAHENSLELEQIRAYYNVKTAVINRNLLKSEESSPFKNHNEDVQRLREKYKNCGKPLALIAPFWDDTLSYKSNNEGGYLDYRIAIEVAWNKTQWFENVDRCSGYIERPLYHTDRDIDLISCELAEVPVILIHGKIQGRRRVHPEIVIWNLLPNQGNNYFHLVLDSFDIKNQTTGDIFEFQDYVANYLATVVGVLSDIYQLSSNGSRPYLARYATPCTLHKLKLLAEQLSLHYDLVCYTNPMREPFYRLDQAIMLYECELIQEANQQIENSLASWYYQKTKNNISFESFKNFNEIYSLATHDDKKFLNKLADVYQAFGHRSKSENIYDVIANLKHGEYELPDMLKK